MALAKIRRVRGERRMLKITGQKDEASESMSLILEGRLAGPWIGELDSYWRQMSGDQQSCTVVDLTGVTFVDAEGRALLTQMWRQGARLKAIGCLNRCVVEEITKGGRAGLSRPDGKGKRKGADHGAC